MRLGWTEHERGTWNLHQESQGENSKLKSVHPALRTERRSNVCLPPTSSKSKGHLDRAETMGSWSVTAVRLLRTSGKLYTDYGPQMMLMKRSVVRSDGKGLPFSVMTQGRSTTMPCLFYHSLAWYNCPLMITSPTELCPDNRPQNHVVNPTYPPHSYQFRMLFPPHPVNPFYQSLSQVGDIVSPTLTVSSTI